MDAPPTSYGRILDPTASRQHSQAAKTNTDWPLLLYLAQLSKKKGQPVFILRALFRFKERNIIEILKG